MVGGKETLRTQNRTLLKRGGQVTLPDLCKGVYPACPTLKSQAKFIDALFEAAGSKPYISDSYKKQIFSNADKFTDNLKLEFWGKDNIAFLTAFFERSLADDKLKNVIAAFGIPEKDDVNKKALSTALAMQFRAIVNSDTESGEDVLLLEYQKNKELPEEDAGTAQAVSVLYPGDQVYPNMKYRPVYSVNVREDVVHTWNFSNVGTQTWTGRRLYFQNHDEVRPRASSNYIDIPDTPPGKSVKVSVSMNAHGFEGKTECVWIMVDADGNDCFQHSGIFTFVIDANFKFE